VKLKGKWLACGIYWRRREIEIEGYRIRLHHPLRIVSHTNQRATMCARMAWAISVCNIGNCV